VKSINKVEIAVSAETQCGIVPPKSILVVEDDHHLRQHVVDILVQAGYAVTSAVDGDAGWEELQLNRYDLIITDNQMPKMTGLEMVEKMRCASMSQPVIMVTGCMPPRVCQSVGLKVINES
jgi:CheY-like chemotaxis protein